MDSLTSGSGNLNVYNVSTPAQMDSNVVYLSYGRSFGDGDSSNLQYPVHQFDSVGAYQVCVTVRATYANGYNCSDTYCKTIGLDSLGNILGKTGSTGFTLNVLNPDSSIGLEEESNKSLEISIYPNPAKEFIFVDGLKGKARFTIYTINGKAQLSGFIEDNTEINILSLSSGIYIIGIQTESDFITEKLIIK